MIHNAGSLRGRLKGRNNSKEYSTIRKNIQPRMNADGADQRKTDSNMFLIRVHLRQSAAKFSLGLANLTCVISIIFKKALQFFFRRQRRPRTQIAAL